ncbi:MAG TPA: succinate dehydrogenase, cytochrome b556 subunit [Burkholderiaceae bacterium]|nr:succinate dehydrogenase, cytochrome b556 subunit [Burkholderiaceae bacterium]HQR71257.1 succinate dehydrogenase, cytochrome b556 subunit [Burkholderiaceae bacterium]
MNPPVAASKSRPEFRNIHVSQILQYRLPPPGMVSIMHRVSGALLFLTLPFLLWLFDLSLTSEISYGRLTDFASHWLARLVLVGLAWAFLHHLVAGVRYLLLDLHIGVAKPAARTSALAVYGISLPLTLVAALKIFGAF